MVNSHQVNLSKAEVIDSHPFVTTRCLLESWHIQRHPNTLNREKGTVMSSDYRRWVLRDMQCATH